MLLNLKQSRNLRQLIWTLEMLCPSNSSNICNNNKCNLNNNSKPSSYNINKWWRKCHLSNSKFIKLKWWPFNNNKINIKPHCYKNNNNNSYNNKSKKRSMEVISNLMLKLLPPEQQLVNPQVLEQLELELAVTCKLLSNTSNNKPNITTKSRNWTCKTNSTKWIQCFTSNKWFITCSIVSHITKIEAINNNLEIIEMIKHRSQRKTNQHQLIQVS